MCETGELRQQLCSYSHHVFCVSLALHKQFLHLFVLSFPISVNSWLISIKLEKWLANGFSCYRTQ